MFANNSRLSCVAVSRGNTALVCLVPRSDNGCGKPDAAEKPEVFENLNCHSPVIPLKRHR